MVETRRASGLYDGAMSLQYDLGTSDRGDCMGPGYSPDDEQRLARLRERIGTSTKATRRRQIFDEHVRQSSGAPRDIEDFRDSFRHLTEKLQSADTDSFNPTGSHSPTFTGPFGPGSTSSDPGSTTSVSARQMACPLKL